MYGYGIDVVTNNYQFLFRFALETNALIKPDHFDNGDICDRFTLLYSDKCEMERAKDLLEALLGGVVSCQ